MQAQQQAQIYALDAGLQQLNGSLAVLASQQTSDVTALNSTISTTAANLATTAAALQSQISSLSASQQNAVAGLQQNLSDASAALQSSISGVGLQLADALQSLSEALALLHSGLCGLRLAFADGHSIGGHPLPAGSCLQQRWGHPNAAWTVSWWSEAGEPDTCIAGPQLQGRPHLGCCQLLPSLLYFRADANSPDNNPTASSPEGAA